MCFFGIFISKCIYRVKYVHPSYKHFPIKRVIRIYFEGVTINAVNTKAFFLLSIQFAVQQHLLLVFFYINICDFTDTNNKSECKREIKTVKKNLLEKSNRGQKKNEPSQ